MANNSSEHDMLLDGERNDVPHDAGTTNSTNRVQSQAKQPQFCTESLDESTGKERKSKPGLVLTMSQINDLGKDCITVEGTGKADTETFETPAFESRAETSANNPRPGKGSQASRDSDTGYLNDHVTGTPHHQYLELQNSTMSERSNHHYEDISPKSSIRSRTENEYMPWS